MTTTTVEYWSVIPRDGIEYPLNTLAKNIETWGDNRQAPVPLRGADQKVPWMAGEQEMVRVADARVMGLGMWVRGCDDDGGVPIGSVARAEFNHNWMLLKRILHNQGRVFTLRKRFYDEARVLRTADARARFDSGLVPSMLGTTGARFTVDLRLADPYFYSTAVVLALNTAASAGLITPTILGDTDPRKISLAGTAGGAGCSNVSITSVESGHTITLDKAVPAAGTILIDTALQSARINGVYYASLIDHQGSTDWFRLVTGVNNITASCNTGAWTGNLTYYPTWN